MEKYQLSKDKIVKYFGKFWKDDVADEVEKVLMKEHLKHPSAILLALKGGVLEVRFYPESDHPPVDVIVVDMDAEGSGKAAIVEIF